MTRFHRLDGLRLLWVALLILFALWVWKGQTWWDGVIDGWQQGVQMRSLSHDGFDCRTQDGGFVCERPTPRMEGSSSRGVV